METTVSNVVHLTTQEFKNKVFNYDVNKVWKYEGELPAIIDFYADWCGPCKMVAPTLQDIARDYSGKIVVYKVDTEKEHELASAFGISSIPTILFVPKNGQPQASMGALPRQSFDKVINDVLLKN
jgi:thioredoxin 1